MLNYSVIIPHYDIPDLLLRCLGSIPQRTDTEVLVVDDGSPGAESYPERYPELGRRDVTFIRCPERKGAGAARNIGLSRARGEWILFADADDYFSEELNAILDQSVTGSEDILFFRKRSVRSSHPEEESDRDAWIDGLYDDYFRTGDGTKIRCLHYVPWGKIFRRRLIMDNGIRFDEIPYSNDVLFSVRAGLAAERIAVRDRVLYICTEREDSLSHSFCRKHGELELRCDVLFRAQSLFAEKGIRIMQPQLVPMLSRMLREDRILFRRFFSRLPEAGLSRWTVACRILRRGVQRIMNRF